MQKYNNKYELQNRLEDYLNSVTTATNKNSKQFVCPLCGSGTKTHHTGALSLKIDKNGIPRATCFACGELRNSDIFEVIGKIEQLSDFTEQYKKACELFLMEETSTYPNTKNNTPIKKKVSSSMKIAPENQILDYSELYEQAHTNIYNTEYLTNRGISTEIIELFSIGYINGWKHPDSKKMLPKNGLIIPISKYSYIFRDTNALNPNYRYFRIKSRNTPEDRFLGFNCLTESDTPIYIVEGEIDALSIYTGGEYAVSLGSVANANDFFDACKDLNIKAPLVFFMDNDKAGQDTIKVMRNKLKEVNRHRDTKQLNHILAITFPYFSLAQLGLGNEKDASDILKKLGQKNFKQYLKEINKMATNNIKEYKQKDVNATDGNNATTSNTQTNLSTTYYNTQYVNFKINNFLAEEQNEILKAIHNSKKSLLDSPMGTGKTRLIKDINTDKNIVTVIVNPSVGKLKQMDAEYNILPVYGGLQYCDENIVCVTPESLKRKVISKLNKPFILVVDEAHEIYSSYNFRKSFADIKDVEKLAKRTIYMTATPDILEETEEFDSIIRVRKPKQTGLSTKIIETNKLSIDEKIALIKDYLNKYSLVVFHNDNKKENEAITEMLNKELKIKVKHDENFQENLLGIEPEYEIQTKDTAVAVDASKKENKTFEELTKTSKIDKDVRLFCTTSCIQAGLNINNDRDTAIIYTCNSESFKLVNFIQASGRYRVKENIKEIILLKRHLDKRDMSFRNFSTIYDDHVEIYKDYQKAENKMLKKYGKKYLNDELAQKSGLMFNKETNQYEIDYHQTKAEAHRIYNKSLLYYPEILKKELENNSSIKLSVTIEQYNPPELDPEIKEQIKLKRKLAKEIFKDTTTKMLEYDDDTILQILEYKIDKRKKANQSLIDIMNNYHDNVSTTFKNVLNSVMSIQEIDKAQAFRFIMKFETLQEVKNQILITQVHKVNADIKVMGIDLPYEAFNGYPNDIRKILLIRYILRDIEAKQGRISTAIKAEILEQAIKSKIYRIKSEDDRKKASSEIEKLINIIYKFDTQNKIQSINYTKQI